MASETPQSKQSERVAPRGWLAGKLGNFMELKRGYDLPASTRDPGRVPVISSSGPSGTHGRAMVKAPGVVTGRYGTIGQVYYALEDFWPLNTTLYVRDFKGNDPRFISYFMRTIDFYSCSDKAAVPGVNRNHLHELQASIPPLPEQRAIAHILGTLDDKIELNRRTNETLEAMARALFKSWFVDFDPVHAKKAGRKPEGMDAETAALFPDDFEDSEMGKIPRGWRAVDVYRIATVDYGAPYSSRLFAADVSIGLPVIRIRDLASHSPSVRTAEKHPKEVRVLPGDVLVGMDGEFRPHVWAGEEALLNQRVCRFVPLSGVSPTYLRLSLEAPLAFVERTEVATTVIHLGKADIDRFQVLSPSSRVLAVANRAFGPTHLAWVARSQESRTLAALRDALLPQLLSGSLRVPEAMRLVEKAI